MSLLGLGSRSHDQFKKKKKKKKNWNNFVSFIPLLTVSFCRDKCLVGDIVFYKQIFLVARRDKFFS